MNTTITNLLSRTMSVYSGRDGKCCCGCAGKHYVASRFREESGASRGYPVKDTEISDAMVAKVTRLIAEHQGSVETGDGYVSIVIGKRVYIAYIVPSMGAAA